jgi:hypothetical protein
MLDRGSRDVQAETALEQPAALEEPAQGKFAGGELPPVHAEKPTDVAAGGAQHTASEKAYAEDDHERELKTKVGALVQSKFGGDYKAAFDHYDADKSASIDKNELVQLLSDAGVGNGLTRGTWASRIIDKLDSNADGAIEWSEFESVFTARA